MSGRVEAIHCIGFPVPSVPSKQSVYVTVKSDLAELRNTKLEQQPVSATATWEMFLKHNHVTFDKDKHAIKSSKHLAYGDDPIQETASFFQRKYFHVKIIPITKRQRIVPVPVPCAVGANSLLRNGNEPRTSTPTMQKPTTPSAPSFGASPIPNRPTITGTRKSTSNGVAGTGSKVPTPAPAQAVPRTDSLPGPSVPGPSGLNQGQGSARVKYLEDVIGPNMGGKRMKYAESVFSQDSQPDDPEYNDRKRIFMEMLAKVHNTDFDNFYHEVKAIHDMQYESRYRWYKKFPLFGGFLMEWAKKAE